MRGKTHQLEVRVLPTLPKSIFNISKRFILPLMGQSYFIECPKCQYQSKEIILGVGFLFGNVENIIDTLKGHDKEQVQRLLNEKLIHTHYSKGFSVYQCQECHSLDNKVHLTLYDIEGGLLFRSESYCGDCQKVREYMPEDNDQETIPDLHCPKCNHNTLHFSEGMLWD